MKGIRPEKKKQGSERNRVSLKNLDQGGIQDFTNWYIKRQDFSSEY